ncbi:vacuolar assembling/sorting protein VPS16 [Clavulina sp. PMI_390]|nr:vacuolar assembling/sorting protein VPS16 [Clavulina sp. PMI_390]
MTTFQHPTASWDTPDDGASFYRRQEVYTMSWNLVDLSAYIVAGARRGGPLAITRDASAIIEYGASISTKPQIQIYSSSGTLIRTIPWDLGRIIRMGWTYDEWNTDEHLVVLNEEGIYRLYDLQGDYSQHSLGSDAQEAGIIQAVIHETGMVALTGHLTLIEVKGWDASSGRPSLLAPPGLVQPPTAWDVLPPDQTVSRHVEVLVSSDSTILSVDSSEAIDQRISRGPFSKIAVSPNGKAFGLLTTTGTLWVVSSNFQESYAEYDTTMEGMTGEPRQLAWCGNDTLVMNWDGLILMVGPYGSVLRYYYTSPTVLITEHDGVRIISHDRCDFLQKVPRASEQVFKPGSASPAAVLLDAFDLYEKQSPRADETIRNIRPELAGAVDVLIAAAGQELEPYWQKRLLNTALYGRAFLDLFDPSDFVEMGKALKVLNAIRYYEVGLPLTYAEFKSSPPEHLISRLTSRNMHILALRISSFLDLKPDVVLRHWAAAKILHSQRMREESGGATGADGGDDDAAICKLIVDKFEKLGADLGQGVSYSEVAKKAWMAGRSRLATMLLDHEPKAGDQVPLLLAMKEDRLALTKAIDSGDTDLVYHVLLHLKRRLNLGDFFKLIEDGGEELRPAASLLQVYAREQNRDLLKDFYFQDDRRTESAALALEEAASSTDVGVRMEAIKTAAKFFSEDKERSFEAKMTNDGLKLLKFQQQVEKEVDGGVSLTGLSVSETIRACIVAGLSKKADNVKREFEVPDKRFWWIKLQALIDVKDWEGLDALAKAKKSPIGYEPFVQRLVSKGFPKQAAQFVPRCDAKRRPDLYVLCGEWRQAGLEAKERGDSAKLQEIRKKSPNDLIARQLDEIIRSSK